MIGEIDFTPRPPLHCVVEGEQNAILKALSKNLGGAWGGDACFLGRNKQAPNLYQSNVHQTM